MSIIGKKIQETRISKGLTQEDLAELSKVNLRTIQRIENNESEPRGKTLSLICDALGISLEEVLCAEEEQNPRLINPNIVFGYRLASKGTRLLANLTEFLIFSAVIILPLVIYGLVIKKSGSNSLDFIDLRHITVFSLVVGAVFYPMFKGNLGHRIFGLKVISSESGKDYNTASEGAIREFLKWMLGYFLIPMIWILWDDKNQNLYDKFTKTYVVEKSISQSR